jgi:N6-L-threonylcarbamoyladenine synthase/protein kinase Bud32
MRVLGIESTAHTFGVGIVDGDPTAEGPQPDVLANQRALYTPAAEDEPGGTTGGIHPREAANHHAREAAGVLEDALAEAGVGLADVDAIAFSQSPGLGPCLRTGATVARSLALREELPLVGVNHCVAHVEIGRAMCDVEDPLLLYASGANTQVIAYARDRYRVVGETLDIGVGNFLDKLARRMGQPFPGGPEIERLAARGHELLELPYTIKGMDVAFSGILTAASKRLQDGHDPEDVAYSVQETAYAMLTEVTERALAHVGKADVVLGGGVACNERLAGMVNRMCAERGARSHRPAKPLLVDNGAMIAWAGAVAKAAGHTTPVSESRIDQKRRTDQVPIPWRREPTLEPDPLRGGEAIVTIDDGVVTKTRPSKDYRADELDARLRRTRTRREALLLARAREAGVATPIVLDVDVTGARLCMREAGGERLRDTLDELAADDQRRALEAFGRALARLHRADVAHGDPTTSNAFLHGERRVELIDFGLARPAEEVEPKATDLHVLDEALDATHDDPAGGFEAVLAGYREAGEKAVLRQLEEVRSRGRYRGSEDAA